MGNYNRRMQFISDLISIKDKKQTGVRIENVENSKCRMCTVQYFLHYKGSFVVICKGCFIRTFDITNKFMEHVIAKKTM